MKKLFLFLAMASTTMFVSCGSDDNGGGTTDPVATSITLTSSLPTIEVGQSVTLTVTDNLTNNVTSSSTFTANGVAFTGPTFTGATAGTFTLVAKNGELTSAPVVVTVTAPAPTPELNNVFFNGQNYSVNQSAAVFWGGYDVDGDDVADHALWSVLVFVGTDITTASSADSAQYVDVEFLTPLDSEGALVFPTVSNIIYLDIYEMWLNSTETDVTAQTTGTLVLTDDLTNDLAETAFVATSNITASSAMELNYDGSFLGIFDGTAKPAAKGTKVKSVVSLAKVAKAKASFYKNLKK